jgi:hypothetical protein
MAPETNPNPSLVNALVAAADKEAAANLSAEMDAKVKELDDAAKSSEVEAPTPKMDVKRPAAPLSISQRHAQKKAKKMAARRDELKEKLSKSGLPEEAIAEHVETILQREEYDKLPLDQKVARLEAMVVRGFQGIANEMRNLQHNDFELADAMDVNFRGLGKVLAQLGVSPEDQQKIMEAARADIEKERADQAEAQRKAQAAAQAVTQAETTLAKAVEGVAEKRAVEKEIDKPGESSEPPAGEATVFGG